MIFALHGNTFGRGVCFGSVQGFLNTSARPLLLNYLILAFLPESQSSVNSVATLLVVFGIVVLLEGWFKVLAGNTLATEFGAQILSWLIPLIHRKSARIRRLAPEQTSDHHKSTGTGTGSNGGVDQTNRAATSEVALVAKDSLDTVAQFNWIANFPQCVVGIIAGTGTLIFLLGTPSIIGMLTMVLSLSLNRVFAQCGGRMAASEMAAGDARLTVMREIVESIVPLKYLTWEEQYLKLIDEKRDIECKWLYRIRLLTVTSVTIGRVSPVLAACATFTFMGLNGYPLTPNIIFASLATFNALRMPLITIPLNLIQLKTIAVSFNRITGFLCLDEHEKCSTPLDQNVAVCFDNASCAWGGGGGGSGGGSGEGRAESSEHDVSNTVTKKEKTNTGAAAPSSPQHFTLSNINVTIQKGQLVAIVGRVGCGKSTLLSSLLGEVKVLSGTVSATTDVGYVPQKPFVLSGTVLENIMMGREQNKERLEQALVASDFKEDLKLLPGGLETEIGERGMTLSGGQKQRLAIARSVYGNPELLVVDDALAAVDGKVASKIFANLCLKRRKGNGPPSETTTRPTTTVVALNQLSFLPSFDHIVFLVDGTVHDQGTFDVLMARNALFQAMVSVTGGESLDDIESPVVASSQRKQLTAALTPIPVLLTVSDVMVDTKRNTNEDAGKVGTKPKEEMEETTPSHPSAATGSNNDGGIDDSSINDGGIDDGGIDDGGIDDDDNNNNLTTSQLQTKGKLVDDDQRRKGSLSGEAIQYYLAAAGGWWWISGACIIGVLAYGQMAATDLWLAEWVRPKNPNSTEVYLTTVEYGSVYVGLSLGQSIAVWSMSMWNNCATNRASRAVHHDCIDRLLHAPSSWFQKTPSGRIMSRFSGDMAMMDKMFAYIMDDMFQFTFLLLGLLVTICFVLPEMIAIFIVGLMVYGCGVVAVDRTNREAKREANLALSPVITTLAETITGRALIHAMECEWCGGVWWCVVVCGGVWWWLEGICSPTCICSCSCCAMLLCPITDPHYSRRVFHSKRTRKHASLFKVYAFQQFQCPSRGHVDECHCVCI